MSLSFYIFVLSFLGIFFYTVSYLLVLLTLELVLLMVFVFFCYRLGGETGFSMLFFFLLMMVCMGGYGISLLIFLSRVGGGDFWVLKFLF